ncbi:MAG TPA: uridine diphosphate-N-acetylglucosamine-binding protein YvcK [Candidatus Acidoferrales bacterium]|nr:uridine diphosphate-N-acetylglucosamine-binding protein YvcK [Candidatus Acidoferrales bacterium]
MALNSERSYARPGQAIRVVAIGGGTGLSTLLKGLKRYTVTATETPSRFPYISDLTAVVTVSDDGGSSGRLRRELNMLPPGDIRNCLVALSADENLLSKLFQFRFSSSGELEGHSFGNLFLAALTAMTGDFPDAVKKASEILATRGHILPATSANVELEAIMNDGSRVSGETKITASDKRVVELTLVPAHPEPLPQTLEAIAAADIITIGPGSLFTSLIPNLLVRGIPEAIAASTAVKVFICNLMTEANESLQMSASDHIMAIYSHSGHGLFNYALVNSAPVSQEMKRRYEDERAEPVECDCPLIESLGVTCIAGNFLEEREVVRHDTDRLCRELLRLAHVESAKARASHPALR